MKWTAICVNLDGEISFTFSFVSSHSRRVLDTQEQTSFEVSRSSPAIIPYTPRLSTCDISMT